MPICKLDSNNYCERHKCIHFGRLLEISQMDNEFGEKHRQLWDKQMEPGYAEKVKNFANSTIKFFQSGRQKTSDAQYAERLSICETCDHCDKSVETWHCKLCGCPLKESNYWPGKARWATEDCPDKPPRWPKIELPVVSGPGCGRCPGSQ